MGFETDLGDIVLNADYDAAMVQQSIDATQARIDEEQAKQDSFQDTLAALDQELHDYLDSTATLSADWILEYGDYYQGNLLVDATIREWEAYRTLTTNFLRVAGDEFESTDTFSIGQRLYFGRMTPTKPVPYGNVINHVDDSYTMNMIVGSIASDTTAAMTLELINGGYGWDASSSICIYLTELMDEFDFINNLIFHEIGLDGTYGTIENIAQMEIAKTLLQGNKDMIVESKTKLARFST